MTKQIDALKGQPLYAALYYERGQAGAYDVKHEHAVFFLVTDEDRAAFPELGAVYGVGLQDTKAGPIETMLFASKAEYDDYLGLDETSEPLEADQ